MAKSEVDKPNLFQALLTYRPRDKRHSNENFLTEGLVYFLRKDAELNRAFVKLISGIFLDTVGSCSIQTQAQDRSCRPDIKIEGFDQAGNKFELWIENKWTSGFDEQQFRGYAENLSKRSNDRKCHLAFIAVSPNDIALARECRHIKSVSQSSHAWKSVRSIITDYALPNSMAAEFCLFMKARGLGGIEVLALDDARRCQKQITEGGLRSRHGFRGKLIEFCNEILRELQVQNFKRYESYSVSEREGRVAIRNGDELISLGLLYHGRDHCTELSELGSALDICLRLQGNYVGDETARNRTRNSFEPLRQFLELFGFDPDPNRVGWRNNPHTIVLAQMPFPWREFSTGEEQAAELVPLFNRVFEAVESHSGLSLKRY